MKRRDNTNPITDHALLRWMQREKGIDVEAIRDELADDFVRGACAARASKVIIGSTEFRICPEGKVRTILNKNSNAGNKAKKRNGKSKGRLTQQQRLEKDGHA